MTSFKISNTLCPCPRPDNLLSTNLNGNINTFKIIFEDQYVKLFWNPAVKQIQVSFKIADLVVRGINEIINIHGNNTIAFQLSPNIDKDHYLTDKGLNLNRSFSYNTSWNTGIIKFTSIGIVKLPYYTIAINTFATSVFFTITKRLT